MHIFRPKMIIWSKLYALWKNVRSDKILFGLTKFCSVWQNLEFCQTDVWQNSGVFRQHCFSFIIILVNKGFIGVLFLQPCIRLSLNSLVCRLRYIHETQLIKVFPSKVMSQITCIFYILLFNLLLLLSRISHQLCCKWLRNLLTNEPDCKTTDQRTIFNYDPRNLSHYIYNALCVMMCCMTSINIISRVEYKPITTRKFCHTTY